MQENETLTHDEKDENNSSIFEKTDPDLRRRLNTAIIDRDPPTYKGVFAKFNLADLDISYHAFYRYARRLRSRSAMFEIAELTNGAQSDLHAVLPKVLAQRLIEVLAFEDVSPRHIQRLTDAYKTAVNTQIAIRRHGLFREKRTSDAETNANADITELLKQYQDLVEREEAANKNRKQEP